MLAGTYGCALPLVAGLAVNSVAAACKAAFVKAGKQVEDDKGARRRPETHDCLLERRTRRKLVREVRLAAPPDATR